MIVTDSDVGKIAECIQDRYGNVLSKQVMSKYGWSHPVLNLIDCVLSLNRQYYEFAKPRVEKFRKKKRDIVTLQQLKYLISQSGGNAAFFRKELDYNDPDRADVLYEVLNRLIDIVEQFPGRSEFQKIGQWAISVSP